MDLIVEELPVRDWPLARLRSTVRVRSDSRAETMPMLVTVSQIASGTYCGAREDVVSLESSV